MSLPGHVYENWLQGIEKIFRAMAITNEQKVRLATHMLAEEAEFLCPSEA